MLSTDAKTKNRRKKIVISVIAIIISACILLITFGGNLGVPSWSDVFAFCGISADLGDDFSASFVNVGTADACCIKCHGKTILIDSGTNITVDKLTAYLRRNNFESLDAVIISHPDSDHIGGMRKVLEKFDVNTLYMTQLPEDLIPETEEYANFLNSLEENKINIVYPKISSTVNIGDMKLEFISPQKEYNNRNDYSLVVKITYGKNTFLFTGDISEKVEKDLLNSDAELKSDVLKVAHHASKTSSSEDFLKAVSPEISVVSVGTTEDDLPDYGTLALINQYSDELYRTDRDKTVVITSDGKNLKVQTRA